MLAVSGAGFAWVPHVDCELHEQKVLLARRVVQFRRRRPDQRPAKNARDRGPSLAHIGDYRRLGESHARLSGWARENGYTLHPVCWEIYDHWRDNPETIRTDLFHLIE